MESLTRNMVQGIQDDSDGAISELLTQALGDPNVLISVYPGGDEAPGVANCMQSVSNELSIDGEHTGVMMFDGGAEGDSGPERCLVLQELATKTTTGNSAILITARRRRLAGPRISRLRTPWRQRR